MEFAAKQIAEFIHGRIEGDENTTVSSFAKIEEGKEGALSFLSNPKYLPYVYNTKSSIIIINNDVKLEHPTSATLIRVPNAYKSVIELLKLYASFQTKETGVSELAFISPKVTIGKNATIYPFVYIGDNVTIGDDVTIYANVSIYSGCKIGNRVIVHSGSVIGSDGFGFMPEDDGYEKVPHIGTVIIEDDVEIGANTCIDRGTIDATIIHQGVKLDNLVHIAHNAEIGANTVMSAQVGIAGSTKIGEWCMFGGQVGVAGHITIGDKVLLGAQSGVPTSIKDGQQLIGTPPMEKLPFFKSHVIMKQLPEILKEITEMKMRMTEIEKRVEVCRR